MELRHLRYFATVVREAQFVRASARLHVAQSALSQQMLDLERELGTALLVRDRRGITPTPAGSVLLRHAEQIFEHLDDARSEIAQLSGVVSGTLRVGMGSPTGPVGLMQALAEVPRRHPLVEVFLQDTTSTELLGWLKQGRVDVALISLDPADLPASVEATLVAREPLRAFLPSGDRLADADVLSLAELADRRLVTFPRGSGVRDAIEAGFAAAGLAMPGITAETIDPLTMLELVACGLGVALAPESLSAVMSDAVRSVPLSGYGLERLLTLAWARERRNHPALVAFLSLVLAPAES